MHLEWDDIVYGDSLNFLDLNISIDSTNRIVTKSYQKPLNLYQYIPPHSAHPPHMMRGIIYSLMRNYKLQNTYESDYIKMAKLLFECHVARGWDQGIMKEYILAADYQLRQNPPKLVKPMLRSMEKNQTTNVIASIFPGSSTQRTSLDKASNNYSRHI